MPELPEVEVLRRGLNPALQGRRLQRMQIVNPRLRWPVSKELQQACLGQTLEEKIRGWDCVGCGGPLTALLQRYPESYLDSSLRLLKHVRGRIPPRDSDSIVREFDSI